MNRGWTGKDPALDVTLLSLHPKVMRFRGMLTAKECALLRFLMLEALIYLDDLGTPLVSSRPGAIRGIRHGGNGGNASAAFGELGSRPWLRSQNTGHISFYFKEPPEFMNQLIERVGKIAGVHPNNVEPIYHLYVPATLPSNLHLDNFNKYLFPHRYLSVSLFLDDHEDGGTVFPLMLDSFGDTGGSTTLALDHDEVQKWQRVLNEERLQQVRNDSEAYAHRRLDLDEPMGFRHRLLEAAQLMCRSGRMAQMPVLPEKGTMYLWFNYLPNGEDDVRSIHAGCSSSVSYKMLGAFFLRDAAGPFPEHDSFWHPSEVRQQANDELQRQVEMMAVNAFRFDHIAALFNMERHAVFELHGAAEAVRLATFHHEYAQQLVQREVGSSWRSELNDIIHEHGLDAEVPWYRQSMDGFF